MEKPNDNEVWSLDDLAGGSLVMPTGWHSPTLYLTVDAPTLMADHRVGINRKLCLGFTRWDMYIVAFNADMQVREIGWFEGPLEFHEINNGRRHPYAAKDVVLYKGKLYIVVNNPGIHPHYGTKCFVNMTTFQFEEVALGYPVVGNLELEELSLSTDLFEIDEEKPDVPSYAGYTD